VGGVCGDRYQVVFVYFPKDCTDAGARGSADYCSLQTTSEDRAEGSSASAAYQCTLPAPIPPSSSSRFRSASSFVLLLHRAGLKNLRKRFIRTGSGVPSGRRPINCIAREARVHHEPTPDAASAQILSAEQVIPTSMPITSGFTQPVLD